MKKAPVLFVGHGSPMNAIEDNAYTQVWEELGQRIKRPRAILSVSAHWYTKGIKIMNQEQPKTIYDMYGFPKELYEVQYAPKGDPGLAQKVKELIGNAGEFDQSWGIDHGTWSVLCRMYPKADIPVIQLSVNALLNPQRHYEIGQMLKPLRDEDVFIFGTGNVVHNLRMVNWSMENQGFAFANNFDQFIRDSILKKDFSAVVEYQSQGEDARLSVPTADHFSPLLYVLGACDPTDDVEVLSDSRTMGSLSMTSYLFT